DELASRSYALVAAGAATRRPSSLSLGGLIWFVRRAPGGPEADFPRRAALPGRAAAAVARRRGGRRSTGRPMTAARRQRNDPSHEAEYGPARAGWMRRPDDDQEGIGSYTRTLRVDQDEGCRQREQDEAAQRESSAGPAAVCVLSGGATSRSRDRLG